MTSAQLDLTGREKRLGRAAQLDVHAQVSLNILYFLTEHSQKGRTQASRIDSQTGLSGYSRRFFSAPADIKGQTSLCIERVGDVLAQEQVEIGDDNRTVHVTEPPPDIGGNEIEDPLGHRGEAADG